MRVINLIPATIILQFRHNQTNKKKSYKEGRDSVNNSAYKKMQEPEQECKN